MAADDPNAADDGPPGGDALQGFGQGGNDRIIVAGGPTASRSDDVSEPTTDMASGDRVLVVEDDDSVRELCRQTLADDGYEVVTAASAEEALELVDDDLSVVQLLVTDVVMPGMDGLRMAAALAGRFPQMGVLLVSGHDLADVLPRLGFDIADSETGHVDGMDSETEVIEFLAKPVAPEELTAAASGALADADDAGGGPASAKDNGDYAATYIFTPVATATGPEPGGGDAVTDVLGAAETDRKDMLTWFKITPAAAPISGRGTVVTGRAAKRVRLAGFGSFSSAKRVALVGFGSFSAAKKTTILTGATGMLLLTAGVVLALSRSSGVDIPLDIDLPAVAASEQGGEDDAGDAEGTGPTGDGTDDTGPDRDDRAATTGGPDDPASEPDVEPGSDVEPGPDRDAGTSTDPGPTTAPDPATDPDPAPERDLTREPDPDPKPDPTTAPDPEPEADPEPEVVAYSAPSMREPALASCTTTSGADGSTEYAVTFTVVGTGGHYDVLAGEPFVDNDERLEIRDGELTWRVDVVHMRERDNTSDQFSVEAPSAFGWADPGGDTRRHTHDPPPLAVHTDECR